MIISATVSSSSMCTLSSMSVCKNAPGMLDTTTYLFSFTSIAHDSTILQLIWWVNLCLLYLYI